LRAYFVAFNFFDSVNAGEPAECELQAEEIMFLQDGSFVQNSSNLKGLGRLFERVTVCSNKGLWSEVMAMRCCTKKDGNR
jgi:hypothetical protein